MNKTEFINAVAAKGEMDKKAAEKAVNAVIAATTDALKNGEKIQLVGFGTFEIRERSEAGSQPENRRDNDCSGKQGSGFQGRQGSQGRC